jgi:hypothetical protein
MKKPEKILIAEEGFELHLSTRPATDVILRMPEDTLASLRKVAESRDMAVEALVKLYVGQGLRNDLARQFGERVIEKTAQVLSRHLSSEEEISAILQEIRVESAA